MAEQNLSVAEDWDADSAEALTRSYEGHLPSVYYADPPASAPAARNATVNGSARRPAAVSATAHLTDMVQDRAWLEGRFADLAGRLAETMQRLDPAEQIAPLSRRLDGIETQLRTALDDTAGKAAYKGLEAQIDDVRKHLDTARQKLERLDGIEAKLGTLTSLAEAHQAGAADGAEGGNLDVTAIVAEAVNRAADRFATTSGASVAPDGIGELRSLITSHVDDYRREQTQTSMALATMQEALVSLIDRIDQYDEHAGGEMADGEQEVEHGADHGAAHDEAARMVTHLHAPVREPAATTPPVHGAAPIAAAAPQPTAQTGERPTSPEATAGPQRSARRIETVTSGASAPSGDPVSDAVAAAAAMAAERARIAAERASQSSARQAVRETDLKAVAGKPTSPLDAPAAAAEGKPKRAARKASARQAMPARRGLLIAGIGMLVVAVSAFAHLLISDRLSLPKSEERVLPTTTGAVTTPRAAPASATPSMSAPVPSSVPSPTEATRPGAAPASPTDARPQSGTSPRAQPAPAALPSNTLPDGFKPKTVPESVDDDLQSNARPAPGTPRASQAAVTGIVLDHTTMANPSELARRMAGQQNAPSDPPAVAQPISTGAQAGSTTPLEPAGRAAPVEMPPATVGPTSLRTAAQQGDPGAQFEVAARFAEGKGIKQDFQQAITWYTRAAQKGFIPAQYRLASLYERGLGTPADITRAKVWYRRAADQGNIKAMHNLAVLAAGPQQADPDYATAVRWFTEAAERGLSDSQFNLGVLAENGLGMTKDAAQAYKWFSLAARSGDKEASRRRDHIGATFTPDEARAAEQLVANWRAKPVEMKANDPRAAGLAWAAEKEAAAQAAAQRLADMRQALAPAAAPMPPPPPAGSAPKAKAAKVTRQ